MSLSTWTTSLSTRRTSLPVNEIVNSGGGRCRCANRTTLSTGRILLSTWGTVHSIDSTPHCSDPTSHCGSRTRLSTIRSIHFTNANALRGRSRCHCVRRTVLCLTQRSLCATPNYDCVTWKSRSSDRTYRCSICNILFFPPMFLSFAGEQQTIPRLCRALPA